MGLQPGIGDCWVDVAETICKRRRSPLHLPKETVFTVPICTAFIPDSEPESTECGLKTAHPVDEKGGVVDVLRTAEWTVAIEAGHAATGPRQTSMTGLSIDLTTWLVVLPSERWWSSPW